MSETHADVVVVGAGPAGSTTAAYLADHGLDVVVLEKASFPRDKVCGDGLTPRAVRQLVQLGVDISDETVWPRNIGLRVYGGHAAPLELAWPQPAGFPAFGLARRRSELDAVLADHAAACGAKLRFGTTVTGPILDASGRITGVTSKGGDAVHAPIVVAADGASSRLGLALGAHTVKGRPMGVAVRARFRSPRTDLNYLESWLSVRDGASHLLPGYGWVFGLGDGTCNVGLGVLNSSRAFRATNYRQTLQAWLTSTPPEWGLTPDNQIGPIGSAALPMGFCRQPAYRRGLLLVGDAGGMISPFNGEGVAYAMEAAQWAADAVAQAHSCGVGTPAAERALYGYPARLKAEWGGYYRLGQAFVALIGHPQVMRICTRYGLPRPVLMRFTMKLLAHLYDTSDGDWMDKVITALSRVVPSA